MLRMRSLERISRGNDYCSQSLDLTWMPEINGVVEAEVTERLKRRRRKGSSCPSLTTAFF